jgi:adenine-specific DNA-methyltransferase
MLDRYAGKITLAYLDPPYATGMDFHSRTQKHAYNDSFGTAAYIEFMRRRLIVLRELLASDGSIYVHIGHQMLFHLKVVLDEVFGVQNFRNLIVRKKCSSKNSTRKQYANLHDYILFYSKTKQYKWNQPSEEPEEEWLDREYPKVDTTGRYKLVPIHAPGTRNGETGKLWRGMSPPPGKHWQFTPERLEEFDKRGEMHWSKNGNPRRKVYLSPTKTRPLTDYWSDFRDAHHQSIEITGYPTEKNLAMLKVIVNASSEPGDIVIDPFAGSAGTLQAAGESGRRWIGIDASATAAEAGLQRLRHGTRPMGHYVPTETKQENLELALPDTKEPHNGNATNVVSAFRFYVESQFLAEHAYEVESLSRI